MDYLQLQAKTLFNLPYRTNAIILLLLSDSSVSYDQCDQKKIAKCL